MKHSDKSEKEIARMVSCDVCSLAFFLSHISHTILSSLCVVYSTDSRNHAYLSSLLQLVDGGVDYEYLRERQKIHNESLAEIQTYLK